MSEKRLYNHKGKEFILEPVSDSVIRVTRREQTGFFDSAATGNPMSHTRGPDTKAWYVVTI